MNQLALKKHLIALATLPENESPVISAYFDLNVPLSQNRADLHSWGTLARSSFHGQQAVDFDDALDEVATVLETGANTGQSAAIFCRWGEYPMVMPLTMAAPMEPQFHVTTVPVIFPLVEMKDRFDRFVLVVTNSQSAQVYEINLGEASQALLTQRPELRKRLGREWTREHYQNHRKEREGQFVKEKVNVIERLMAKRGHNALVLAGEPRYVKRLREHLPKHLQGKVAGEIRSGVCDDSIPKVVEQSIATFLDEENRESHDAVKSLEAAVCSGGLAVVGITQTMEAFANHQVDQLILSTDLPTPEREKLVRMATRQDVPVETVRGSETLEKNGGVGCLLRYLGKFAGQQIREAS